jgi:transposase
VGWTGGAYLFSGRPDPRWPVSDQAAESLLALWDRMRPRPDVEPPAPVLGYRGCFLRATDGRVWLAFRGTVWLTSGDSTEARADEGRMFERLLARSAPEGALPADRIDLSESD